MRFIVNGHVYRVRRRWNLRCNGRPADGACSSEPNEIWIDAELPESSALNTLRHEVAHAFQFETGSPSDFEQVAVFAAAVGEAFDEQFHAQGGISAFRLIPIVGNRKRPRPFTLKPVNAQAAKATRPKVSA